MKRDLNLLREILLTIEENKGIPGTRMSTHSFIKEEYLDTNVVPINEYDTPELRAFNRVSHHLLLLLDEGLIEATQVNLMSVKTEYPDFIIHRLTSCGHDYLDTVRSDTLWNKIKEKAGDNLGSMALSTVSALGQKILSSQLGI